MKTTILNYLGAFMVGVGLKIITDAAHIPFWSSIMITALIVGGVAFMQSGRQP